MRRTMFGLAIALTVSWLPAATDSKGDHLAFRTLQEQARADLSKSDGKAYHATMSKTYVQKLSGGITSCVHTFHGETSDPFEAIVVVAQDGKVSQVEVYPETFLSKCIRQRLLRAAFSQPPLAPFHDLMNISFKAED